RQVLVVGGPAVVFLVILMTFMFQFRTEGLSSFSFSRTEIQTLYIDHNIVVISRLTEAFPNLHEFLGLEVPIVILTKPIPRILWPGKPEGLSFGIESAVSASSGMTVSSTFVGEAYITSGYPGVFLFALLLGVVGQLWNRLGAVSSSNFTKLV